MRHRVLLRASTVQSCPLVAWDVAGFIMAGPPWVGLVVFVIATVAIVSPPPHLPTPGAWRSGGGGGACGVGVDGVD
jgi:hypothetical protein